ncbi:unnamed protein product [Phytomonas sp. Hart1]|nr:unnamed protein product [Phytomonas sp. Hart1]|eukprot:CCW69055.1 unnamed protein product [Phytomonas sp. isolate Hart1]
MSSDSNPNATTKLSRNVLPKGITPSEYWLHIIPNFDDFTFKGSLRIYVHTTEDVSIIKLNALGLTFDKVTLKKEQPAQQGDSAEHQIQLGKVSMDEENGVATIPLDEAMLHANEAAYLSIHYTGDISDKLAGFYRSKYQTSDGRNVYLATTQFEAVDARRAFPCWDEPAHKAVFHITITAPSHMVCISNMHEIARDPVPSEANQAPATTYTFAPSPKMSTYLVAWTIGELDSIRATVHLPMTPEQDTIVSVYTPKGKSSQAQFALDVSVRALPFYEAFFEQGYLLKKMDLVAIPDFAAGAMENWGLITYRESALLCDEHSSSAHRQWVAIVVCHEIAHQWFGNLVTMEWWNELWLNEAFATFMQYMVVNKLFPEWNIFTQFVQTECNNAMELDAMLSSHPVEVEVNNAQEIDEIFDAISYCKGGSIVRMIIDYISEEAFQRGISAYIRHFKYGNANTVDLWKFLGGGAGMNLTPIMEFWTGKQGFPYLHVKKLEDNSTTDGSAVTLEIIQNRFLATGAATAAANDTIWKIPLLIRTPDEPSEKQVLVNQHSVQVIVRTSSWIKANSRQTCFCRVLYDNTLLDALKPALLEKALPGLDRLGIVMDYHAFARGGYVPTALVVGLVKAFAEHEDEFAVWSAIADFERSVRLILSSRGESAQEKLNTYCHSLYSRAMQHVGYILQHDEAQNVAQLRSLIFTRLTISKEPRAMEAARQMYANREKVPIPADLHEAVYTVHVKDGGLTAVDEIKSLIANSTDAVERSRYLKALSANCPNSISVSALFDYCFSKEVKTQDSIYLLAGIMSKSYLVKDYAQEIMKRWDHIIKTLPGLMVGRCISYVGSGADHSVAADLKTFWETRVSEKDKQIVYRSFQKGLEALVNNANWADREVDAIMLSLS